MLEINKQALDAFDVMAAGGVDGPIRAAEPFVFGYTDPLGAQNMIDESRKLIALGQRVEAQILPADRARELSPMLSKAIRSAVTLGGQRFLDPPAFIAALAGSVVARGGDLRTGTKVIAASDLGVRVRVQGTEIDESFDAVVLATGVTLPELAAPFGVRIPMQAGRGYSFSAAVKEMPEAPIYFPDASVVCTPIGGRIRIAGMMEFRPHGAPIDPRRIAA
ncbi:NAD(P)/FAD-dependent oxidoreductase, partial [Rhodococcus erythropolis]|uniref:NAD(P)/FAD-dependent oxidoreductase n=1 Tax=Rhodococcus erythropolis TaxID=1833 RepID=UPI0036731208